MSTQVPAPLYAYSSDSGFSPIDVEPEDSTLKSGLMNKLDRLFNPRSTVQPSSIDPTGGDGTGNITAGTNESQPEESPDPLSFRILTWNIWFETLYKEERTTALIETIKSLNPLPDVCCFQECTAGFERQLQADDWWRTTWAMTKCADQFAVTHFSYGTMVFARRELIEKMEFKVKAWFEPWEVSQTGRGLLVLELTPPKAKNPLLIATSHMDYTPQIRATEFASAISTLSATPTSIFCGDTNIDTYPELQLLFSAGYVDSWLETHPDFATAPNLREVGITFGTVGLRGESMPNMDGPPRRLDYVMARGVRVTKCELIGSELIPKEKWATDSDNEDEELDLEVYVSDHLGILTDFQVSLS